MGEIKDLISIVIPIYNTERYIGQCIKSVIGQTYPDWELILVNDGSTDKSGEICEKYRKKDNRIRYYYQKNQGLIQSRINGIKQAQGKYVLFCDSDDKLDSQMLLELKNICEEFDTDITCCGYWTLSKNGLISKKNVNDRGLKKYSGKEVAGSFSGGNIIKASVWGKLYKKELLDECFSRLDSLPRIFIGEDTMINSILFQAAKSVISIDKCLYYYRCGGAYARFRESAIDELIKLYCWRKAFLLETENKKWNPSNLAQVLNLIIYYYQFCREEFSMKELSNKLQPIICDIEQYGRNYKYREMYMNLESVSCKEFCGIYKENWKTKIKQEILNKI